MKGGDPKTLAAKKSVVAGFLQHCNAYADNKLSEYRAAARTANGPEAEELADKIHDWSAYRKFNEHTIAELQTDRLDAWFREPTEPQ